MTEIGKPPGDFKTWLEWLVRPGSTARSTRFAPYLEAAQRDLAALQDRLRCAEETSARTHRLMEAAQLVCDDQWNGLPNHVNVRKLGDITAEVRLWARPEMPGSKITFDVTSVTPSGPDTFVGLRALAIDVNGELRVRGQHPPWMDPGMVVVLRSEKREVR